MNKRLLIISPYFAPVNSADMQRARMSLPYYAANGWDAELVMVDERYADMNKDNLLLQSIPQGIKIHKVSAFNKKWTSKLGLGSIALRSLWFYKKTVNKLLQAGKYDLVFFTTTQYPVCVLGAYWKKKYSVPYVIDIQDPWLSDYYEDKPKNERPPKYWFSYRLNKLLEPIALKKANGLISVSAAYINDLKARYRELANVPSAIITFGAFEPDLAIALANKNQFTNLLQKDHINIVYIGRGGMDMYKAIEPVFKTLRRGLDVQPDLFKRLKFYFIGTSYAAAGSGLPTIMPLAEKLGVGNQVIELTDRISYYHTLQNLNDADALFIPGSDDPQYTASKIFPYLLTKKPLLAIFNKESSAIGILKECTENAVVLSFNDNGEQLVDKLYQTFAGWAKGVYLPIRILESFNNYNAQNLTQQQTQLFNSAIKHFETTDTNA